jgi:hypothetical protein
MKREFDHAFPPIFLSKEVSIAYYVNGVTRSKEDPKRSGCYDIFPPHQREDVHTDEWANRMIAHKIAYGHIDPIKFHTVHMDNGCSYFENLDGKQRSLGFLKLVHGGLVFRNYDTTDETGTLDLIDGKPLAEWPNHVRDWFLHNCTLTIRTSQQTLTDERRKRFFTDCQDIKRTSGGEHLNANPETAVNVALFKIMKGMKNTIHQVFPSEGRDNSRLVALGVMNSLAFQYFDNGKTSRNFLSGEKARTWNETFTEFSDNDIVAFCKILKAAFDLMISLNVKNKSAKAVSHAFFFIYSMKTPPEVIMKIRQRHAELGYVQWPNDGGDHCAGWRRYKYLVGDYIGCTE